MGLAAGGALPKTLVFLLLLSACSRVPQRLDAGILCSPDTTSSCLLYGLHKCTDGRGHLCAECSPHQLYLCVVENETWDVACVDHCYQCTPAEILAIDKSAKCIADGERISGYVDLGL